ncbi:DNA-methyltransferase [Megalodesulfovibrio paquesii]
MHSTDSLTAMRMLPDGCVDLICTSPPFALGCPKPYGNPAEDEYLPWFRPFAVEMARLLAPTGSLVLDVGAAWQQGRPCRSLYPYEVLLMCCRELGLHLAQELTWWNPATMAAGYWTNRKKERLKDAAHHVWWLAKSPRPKADTSRVLWPYRPHMRHLLRTGRKGRKSPSGHDNRYFRRDNGGAIPHNLIALAHEGGSSAYLRACRAAGIPPHPARFPEALPRFFIRLLTDPGDLVLDPFAGSCTTGRAAERLGRRWLCLEREAAYLQGGILRFTAEPTAHATPPPPRKPYTIFHPEASARGPGDAPGLE